jgi:alpha-glucoside transport system permease protein
VSAATRTENVSGQGRMPRRALIYATLSVIAVVWVLPTVGLLINSFRTPQEIRATGWWTVVGSILDPSTWTLENYQFVLAEGFGSAFINTLAVTVPSVVIPITIAAFAAYAFAWMEFPGRQALFLVVVGLMVVPLQMALIPILRIYTSLDLTGTFPAIWLAHTGFGLPLATYLLRNYMGSLPSEVMESARVDGANHWLIFTRIVLPLSVPVLASFAIFQFLWVWNDYLVALVFLGTEPDKRVLNVQLATISGSGDQGLALLPAGAFVTMLLPLAVFFGLQRYFVRGLTAGSVKG